MPVGVKVTLRGEMMWNFLQKLISIALPRVRDFKGVKRDGFDGRGNFNFGLTEQLVFTEVDYDTILRVHGMNINISTTTEDDKQAERMLEPLSGFPFTKGKVIWQEKSMIAKAKRKPKCKVQSIYEMFYLRKGFISVYRDLRNMQNFV